MIPKERLMELLVQAGSEIGIISKRLPAGWQRFGELVEREAWGTPIDMVLYCPRCCTQHIDGADTIPSATSSEHAWDNPPHRSHLCHSCGFVWRPADVPTNGVQAVKTTGKADSPLLPPMPKSRTALADGTERPCPHPSWANVRLTTGDGTPVDYCNLCKRNQLA